MAARLNVLSRHLVADAQQAGVTQSSNENSGSEHPMLINGTLVQAEGGRVAPVINPAFGKAFDTVPEASQGDLNRAIAGAKEAFKTWSKANYNERAAAMNAFGDELEARADEFAEALSKEQGKPLMFAKGEVLGTVNKCRHLAKIGNLKKEVVHEDKRSVQEVHYIPRGVVAGITPWNFPLAMAANKILPGVITGNTVVLKPSPHTPLSTVMLSEIAAKAFPAGVVNIVTGGDQLGRWMVEHPDVQHVSFTGSARTGKAIMASAAGTLKKLTLELGGNDPAIVLPGSDPKKFAPQIFKKAMFNTGQVCVAIKRLFVHEDQYDEMVSELASEARKAKVGNGLQKGVEYGPINNKMQLDRVDGLVKDAIKDGAKVVAGGGAIDKDGGFYYKPTILSNVSEGMRVVDEEQFGPVLPVLKYKNVDDAVKRANDTDFGLGSSIWGPDAKAATEVGSNIEAGITWINDHLSGGEASPFGGIKASGVGREGGNEIGLKEFVEIKSVRIAK